MAYQGNKRVIKRTSTKYGIAATEAILEFLAEKEALGKSKATLRNYEQSFNYLAEFLGIDNDTPVADITKDGFLQWVNSMRLEGKSASSINHYIRDCRAFLYWCMDEEREYIKPRFKVMEVTAQEEQIKAFKEEDINTLLVKPRKGDNFGEWRTWAIVNFIMATGARSSTVCNVLIGDIDYKSRTILFRHTKNKKHLKLPLDNDLANVLKEYITMWLGEPELDDYLFPNISAEQLTTNALRHSFTKYCNDRGVDQTNIHGLRHSYAIMAIQNGCNAFELKNILGHSTLDITMKYVRHTENLVTDNFENYSPLATLKKPTKRTRVIKRNK